MFARERRLGAVELGLVEFPEVGREVFGGLHGAKDGGEGRGEEGILEVGVFDGSAVEGVAGDVETFGEELALFADAVGNGGGEFAGEGEVAGHLSGKVLG